MAFSAESLTMDSIWAIEDMTGQTMETFMNSGSAKIPFILAWRAEVQTTSPGLGFDEWRIRNSLMSITDAAKILGYSPDDDDDDGAVEADPTSGGAPSRSPGSVTGGR